MEFPITIELYKGTEPYSLFFRICTLMECQCNQAHGLELSSNEFDDIVKDSNKLIRKMHATNLDDVTVDIPNDIRITLVDKLSAPDDGYETYTCSQKFMNNVWHLEILKSDMPPGMKTGLYRCSMRINAKFGFWNRDTKINVTIHSMKVVPCKLYLIIKERTGDVVKLKPKPDTVGAIFHALCADFCKTFQI